MLPRQERERTRQKRVRVVQTNCRRAVRVVQTNCRKEVRVVQTNCRKEVRVVQTNCRKEVRVVGTPGFEPGTSCAPCKHATRLRHVPRLRLVYPSAEGATNTAQRGKRRADLLLVPARAVHQFAETEPLSIAVAQLIRLAPGESLPTERATEPPPCCAGTDQGPKEDPDDRQDEA